MDALDIRHVSHWFGDHQVLHDINLQIAAGQIVAIVGPSGCGKSTLFRAILGTHPTKAGEIYADGERIIGPSRRVGIVYQHYTLYEFLTAKQNVAFGLKMDQTSLPFRCFKFFQWQAKRREHERLSAAFLDKVGLHASVEKYPIEMSGGMRQRVAIAQAMIMKPKVLLLDEPFGALDEATRSDLQKMLLHFYQENLAAKRNGEIPPYTIIIVTHELNEAIYVSDRVIGLSQYHQKDFKGSTIVYDAPSPVFHPDDIRDFDRFIHQRDELRKVVFASDDDVNE